MSAKIWKEYIHRQIEIIEGISDRADEREDSRSNSEDLSDLLEPEAPSWCYTVDRCMAYTFESYCKLVISGALQHTHMNHGSVVTVGSIKKSIRRLFNLYREDTTPSHDCDRCIALYNKHVKWYNRIGHRIYDPQCRSRRNLSCTRHKWPTLKPTRSNSRRDQRGVTVDLGKYEFVPPTHKTVDIPLDKVFGD